MSEEIRVRVVEFSDRCCYQLQWTCPNTGRKKTKSSGIERITGKKKERDAAAGEASKWAEKLAAGDVPQNPRMTWEQFRERFEREVLPRHSDESQKKHDTAFKLVEEMMKPKRLADITTTTVSAWLADMQTTRSPETAGLYGRILRAALNWAKAMGLIQKAPTFRIPRKQAGETMAKGRAIVGEEHDRIKAALAKIVPASRVADWERFLDALWWSGLRLGEAMSLSWEPTAAVTAIVIEGRRPVVRFKAKGQKARRDEIWPCPPEFAAMLEQVPADERTGYVFRLRTKTTEIRISLDKAGRTIAQAGKAAGVITGDTVDDSATAHAYRRSFGTRWAKRVMPAVLKRLMRHREIGTTMKYYVDADAAQIADELWQQFGNGNTSGNTAGEKAAVS
jgi:integrase